MIDELTQLGLSALGFVWGFLGAYVAMKMYMKPSKILEISDILLEEYTDNVEYQKKIYGIAVLLGQGIKKGIGLNVPGGKMKWDDILKMGVAQFIQGRFLQPPTAQEKAKKTDSLETPIGQG